MFKWLQGQIKKKNDGSSRTHNSESVEVATDAAVYDRVIEEQGQMGGNAPSDLGTLPVLDQRQDSLADSQVVFYNKTQETENVHTIRVTDEDPRGSGDCPAKCASPTSSKKFSGNSASSLSSISGAEGIDTRHHYCQEHPNSTHKSTSDTSPAQELSGSALSLQNHRENVDICCKSSNSQDLNKKSVESVVENLNSSTAVPHDPLYNSETSFAHQRSNTLEESRSKDEEKESTFFQNKKFEFVSEVNAMRLDQCVNEAAVPPLQQLVTSEKVIENGQSNEEVLAPAAPDSKASPAEATGAPDLVGDVVPDVQLEREFSAECEKDSAEVEKNTKKARVKDKASQTQTVKYECSNVYCYPESCLYNQKGRKCTVLGEHFILTYLRESPVLVSTALQNTVIGPVGCVNVWCWGKVSELKHISDGTELYFDAIVSPGTSTFVALIIWQGAKPTHSVQPFYNSYVIIELMRNCPIKFVSFSKENGVVTTVNCGKTLKAVFSKSVVYIGGKKTETASEIKKLSISTSHHLYGDVLKLMTLDKDGNSTYEFMCSCIWQGCKPHQLEIPIYDPFKLYKKTPACFPVANKQAMLLCDIDAVLMLEDATYKIMFKSEGQTVVLPYNKKMLFSGNQRTAPVSSRVKVHLRKMFAKGTNTWMILMVQIPPSLTCDTMPSDIQDQTTTITTTTTPTYQPPIPPATPTKKSPILPQTVATKSSPKAMDLPSSAADSRLLTQWPSESDVALKQQCTTSSSVSRKGLNTDHGQPATSSNSLANGEHTKLLPGIPCMSELGAGSTMEELPVATSNGTEQIHFIVKDLSLNSKGVISQYNQTGPLRVVRNNNGVLKNIGEAFILETQLNGKEVQIEVGKSPWVAYEDGRGERCEAPMSDLPVGFDAHMVDIPQAGLVGHILALWTGKKPLKASLGSTTYYFDAPALYHGSDKEGYLEFTVLLDGKVFTISTMSTTALFEASGEQCTSLTPSSHVFLHLSVKQKIWTLFMVVLQSGSKTSNGTQESNTSSPKLSSTPDSDILRYPLNLQAENKTNGVPAMHKTAREYGFTHYLKNLYGTLTETDGKRVICAFNKDVCLSVQVPEHCVVDVNGVATDVRKVSLGTKLRFDAFCEDLDSLSYWTAVIWLQKKTQMYVAPTGSMYYLNVRGKCLNSSDKEVRFEFTIANTVQQVVCKNAYVISPDGTWQALRSLRVGTPVQANIVQHMDNISINNFIYVDASVPLSLTSVAAERNLENSSVTKSVTKMNEEKLQNNSVTSSKKLDPPPSASIGNIEKDKIELKSVTGDTKEAAFEPELQTHTPCEHDIAKGRISEMKHDQYIFTSEGGNIQINVNPMNIAVDPEASPESPLGEFYLVYHKKNKEGKCGWYRRQTHQAYLQHHMIVHSHNLDTRILTLALPDQSSLYNFLFDNEIIVKGTKFDGRFHPLKAGMIVHPIIEDIKCVHIDGHAISHRIVLLTTVKEVAVICLNFLNNPSFDNEEKHDDEVYGDHYGVDFDALFEQNLAEEKHKAEGNVNDSSRCLISSESNAIHHPVNYLLDRHDEDNMPGVDAEGETLRELINTKHPMAVSKSHVTRYVTLCGKIQPQSSGTFVFCSEKLPFPVHITPSIPHCDTTACESQGKQFMLGRKTYDKETGLTDFEPLVVWPEERKCNPYILVTNKVSRRNNLLMVTDAITEEEKFYFFNYDVVFSLKNSYKLNEVIKSYSKQKKMLGLYAVVDKLPSFQTEEHNVEGNILLLTTSKNVAVASIDAFIGCCHEEEFSFQLPLSHIFQMLHLHKIRMDRASKCKRGSTCYYSVRASSFNSALKSVGGCLETVTDDFAIMRCDKRIYKAACLLSNIYYQGEIVTSWETIPKHHWKNLWAIILPLPESIQEDELEVDAVALVAWCCRGPRVLAMHQCYYHVQTPYVPYLGIEESQEATPTSLLLQSQNSSHSSLNCAGKGMSLSELESWRCQAGNTIVAFNDSILQSCGLSKLSGKITLIDGTIVLFTSTENELVKGKVSDIFIKGKRCESLKSIVDEIDQTFTLVAQKCSPTVYLEKLVQMEVLIGFTTSLKGIGIHVCSKHACILENSLLKEEIAIAERVFGDIALVCEQSNQCSDYYLSQLAVAENETPTPPETVKIMKHTLCCGTIVDIDKETPDHVRVSLQQGPDSLTVPVSRSRLMGLQGDLPLCHAVGHKLKVILNTITGDEREEYRILMGWGNFSKDFGMSYYPILKPDLSFSQKSKFHCCPRGFEVKAFQNVYNSNMFEVKSLYRLKKIDVESGRGFFHYWLDEKPISCKIEFIAGWLKVDKVQEELWNLLVVKGYQTEKECAEALAAWQGDCDSLVVEVCDVHGTHGLYVSQEEKPKTKNNPVPSSHKRSRRNSEPTETDLLASFQLIPHFKSRRNSEPLNASLSINMKPRRANTIEKDGPGLSRSLPSGSDHPLSSGLDMSKDSKKALPFNSGSIQLVSIKEDSMAEEGKVYPSEGIEQSLLNQPLCSSLLCDEKDENVVLDVKSERDRSNLVVGNMIKNKSMISSEPENISRDKTGRKLECDPDSLNTSGDMTVTLKVLLRKTETIFGYVEEYGDHCGILVSDGEPVLFDGQLFDETMQKKAASETPQSEKENLKALALELEQPVTVLGFEVKKIAAMVWREASPVIDTISVAENLNAYKMNWDVEFIDTFDQLELEEFTEVLQQNRGEDLTLVDECELLKVMDECGILKVKNSEAKVLFHKNNMLMNNETLTKEKWKDTLQLLMEQEQILHCRGQQLTPQERESVKEKTGEEVQYKAQLVLCTTGPLAMKVEPSATTVPSTALTPNVGLDFLTAQLPEDTDSNTGTTFRENMQPPAEKADCASVKSGDLSTLSSWSEFLLHNKAKREEIFKNIEIFPLHTALHTLPPHPGSLWATRPSLIINPGRQEILSECFISSYADHCGILINANEPILFDQNLISMMQLEEVPCDSSQTEKSLEALVCELDQPVKVLSHEVRKVAMVLWNRKKPKIDNDLLCKSLDVYKLNWIVSLTCWESLLNNLRPKATVCKSFIPVIYAHISNLPEFIYCCSKDYSVRQFRVTSCLGEVVVLEHQDDLVLALRSDVRCSEDELKEGTDLWVISVKLLEPFNYGSFFITHFALLVYSGETDPPEAATIKLEWIKGKIEKVIQVLRKFGDGFVHTNIRVIVDRPSEVKPYLMDPFWGITQDRPEGGMMFAVECEIIRLIKNSGILKVKGKTRKGMEVKIYFRRTAVVVNSRRLRNNIPLAEQLSHLQNQTWRCTCVRLKSIEMASVKKTVGGDDVQYKAKLVWCEVLDPRQTALISEDKGVAKAAAAAAAAAANTTSPPATPRQSAEVLNGHDQVEMEGLCNVDRPLPTGTKPKKKLRKRNKAKDTKDNSDQEQRPNTYIPQSSPKMSAQPSNAQPRAKVGHLTEVHRTVAQIALEDKQLKYVTRDKCFLYGLCLGKVELWHVLSIGLTMKYELTEDGKELKVVWLGEADLMEPAVILDTMRDWCLINNVSSSATTILLLEAGWLPSELTPTVAVEEDVDVVEVESPRIASGFLGHP